MPRLSTLLTLLLGALFIALLTITSVEAANTHGNHGGGKVVARRNTHHRALAERVASSATNVGSNGGSGGGGVVVKRRRVNKQQQQQQQRRAPSDDAAATTTASGGQVCRIRAPVNVTTASASSTSSSTWSSSSTSTTWSTSSASPAWSSSATPVQNYAAATTSSSTPAPAATSQSSGGGGGSGSIWSVTNGAGQQCGCTSSRPNGQNWWLMSGVNDASGWNPPNLPVSALTMASVDTMLSGVASACAPYKDWFNEIGNQVGIPPSLLLAMAVQESGCNPSAQNLNSGGEGTVGMMQIKLSTSCPAGTNCWDPYQNLLVGARLLASNMAQNNGDVLAGLGLYNGWVPGMQAWQFDPVAGATPVYLNQVLNGWLQNTNGYALND